MRCMINLFHGPRRLWSDCLHGEADMNLHSLPKPFCVSKFHCVWCLILRVSCDNSASKHGLTVSVLSSFHFCNWSFFSVFSPSRVEIQNLEMMMDWRIVSYSLMINQEAGNQYKYLMMVYRHSTQTLPCHVYSLIMFIFSNLITADI